MKHGGQAARSPKILLLDIMFDSGYHDVGECYAANPNTSRCHCRACRCRRVVREDAERLASLTPRERDVMELLIVGHAGKEIAALLDISYKTMEKYRAKVMQKMQADSVAELVLMAVNLGLISADGQPPDE